MRYNKEELEEMFRSARALLSVLEEYCKERHKFDKDYPRYVDHFTVAAYGIVVAGSCYHDSEYGTTADITVDDLLSLDDLRAEFEERRRREIQEKLDRARLKAAFDAEEEKRTLRALLAKYPEEAR